jgi:NarL family two-component system response regulator LiaR
MRAGLAEYFTGTGRWYVVGTAGELTEARAILSAPETGTEAGRVSAGVAAVDILLLDIQLLESGWGLDIIPWLREQRLEKMPAPVVYSAFTDYANVSAALSLLTHREAEILTLVKTGLSNKRIAEQLGISHRTVENILSFVYDKTGIHSRLELQKL